MIRGNGAMMFQPILKLLMGMKFRFLNWSENIQCWSFKWVIFGKQNWRCGMNQTLG